MKTQVRPPTHVLSLLTDFQGTRRREVVIDPEGGFFGVKDLASAIKRAGAGDVITLPPGEYPAFELHKNLEIRSAQPGTVTIRGTMRVATTQAILRGLTLRSEPEEPALVSEKGVLAVDDCTVQGRIEAGAPNSKVQLFIRNSLAGRANDAVLLTNQATVEILTSRIADCHIGVALQEGSACAIYHSRIERCVNPAEGNPGAAIYGERAGIYGEGVQFFENGVAAYFRECDDVRLLASHFQACGVAALIATGTANTRTHLRACQTTQQTTGACAQLFVTGGQLEIAHSSLKPAPSAALESDQTQIEILDSSFASLNAAALDLRACQLTGTQVRCASTGAPGLTAAQCRGVLQNSTFSGSPSIQLAESPELAFESCDSDGNSEEFSPNEPDEARPATIDSILERVRKSIGQDAARHELERLLRLAHAMQQRERDGLPSTEQHFHSVFMGAHGTGRLEAAQRLAEGLHALGIVSRPEVKEVLSLDFMENEEPETGVTFVRVRQATSSTSPADAVPFLERLVTRPGQVVILAGERDEIRRLLRASAALDRTFRRTLFFSTYGPAELATVFAQYCERDHIPIGDEAAQALLLAFHLYSERKDKRFANTSGVKALYETTRHRYLERSSAACRTDLELEPRDLDIPADKAVRNAIERCPAFVVFCPNCKKENPWLPGLDKQFVCLHCDTPYSASWGIWKDSTTYRRLCESLDQAAAPALTARRIHLPTR